MKKTILITLIGLSGWCGNAQSISPGGMYAASGSNSVSGVTLSWVLGNINVFPELSALPVRLISFEGKLNAAGLAELHWKTAEEVNNTGFEIQKSQDGKTWELLGWVDGAGNSETEHSYMYVDEQFTTTTYYRLRQVNFDDTYSYSKLVCVIPEKESLDRFYVYPNPSHENKVRVQTPEKTQRLLFFDQLGRKLGQLDRPGTEEIITLPHTGSYILQVETPVGNKATNVTYQ